VSGQEHEGPCLHPFCTHSIADRSRTALQLEQLKDLCGHQTIGKSATTGAVRSHYDIHHLYPTATASCCQGSGHWDSSLAVVREKYISDRHSAPLWWSRMKICCRLGRCVHKAAVPLTSAASRAGAWTSCTKSALAAAGIVRRGH
jgi:hypothetical protein